MAEHRFSPEAAEFLAKSRRGFLVTLRSDGSPTIHPMTALVAEGRLAYNTYRRSEKARNALRDPRTCSLVLVDYDPQPDRALVYKGTARELDPSLLENPGASGAARPVSDSVRDRASARLESGKRVLLGIDPQQTELLERGGRG